MGESQAGPLKGREAHLSGIRAGILVPGSPRGRSCRGCVLMLSLFFSAVCLYTAQTLE
jgi:hypothetical protein